MEEKKVSKLYAMQRKIKFYFIINLVLSIELIILFILFLVFGYFYFLYYSPLSLNLEQPYTLNQIEIQYVGLNYQQQTIAKNLIEQVDSIFLTKTKKIIFVKSMQDYCNQILHKKCDSDLAGFNKGNLIVIEYHGQVSTKEIICHEFLHTFFINDGETNGQLTLNHKLIYNLGEKQVCFPKTP